MTNAKIRSYLNSPLVAAFGTLKEEATKFIMSQYIKGKLWLPDPIKIKPDLISYITGLLALRDLVPMGSRNSPLVEELTSRKCRKNSKGVAINQI